MLNCSDEEFNAVEIMHARKFSKSIFAFGEDVETRVLFASEMLLNGFWHADMIDIETHHENRTFADFIFSSPEPILNRQQALRFCMA
ncbi:hypothetical protein EBR21_02220 [bacterium]|nr:hypothetical protein [bacterium]